MIGLLSLVAGCGTDVEPEVGDASQFYERVRAANSSGVADVGLRPSDLANALPNKHFVDSNEQGEVEFTFSDAVIAGTITRVEPGTAVRYTSLDPMTESEDDEAFEFVDFDDEQAHERNILVTVDVTSSAGSVESGEVTFRMGVIDGGDPYEFMANLRDVGDTLVVLETRESGKHSGEFAPIMAGALLGTVSEDGALSFPGLGRDEASFVGSLDTVDEVIDAANAPSATEPVKAIFD